ncbi:MAG: hypothetical protein CME04_03015 [Gemmatimonadaceae bacterium]|nr:hypothetical protein [Gemmatimonadaceae bacterium]
MTDQIDGQRHQCVRCVLVPADADGGIDQRRTSQSFQAQMGELVGHVAAVLVTPAHHHRNRQTFRDVLVHQQVERLDQQQGLVVVQLAGFNLTSVEGVQRAVQVSRHHQPHRLCVHDPHDDEPEQLDGVAEGLRRIVGDSVA